MIIDSKGRLFGKVSIVDILIAVLIFGVIGGLGYKFLLSGKTTPFTAKDTIRVSFKQDEVRDFIPAQFKIGDMVTDKNTGVVLGKVVEVKTDKANVYPTTDQGKMVLSDKPNYLSCIITVEGTGIHRDGVTGQGISFGSVDYFVGATVELRAGNATMWGAIMQFEKKE